MTIAWQKFDGIPTECAFGWLCGVAVRVAANDDRGRRRRQALVDRLTAEAETRPLGAYLGDEQLLHEQRRAIDDAFARGRTGLGTTLGDGHIGRFTIAEPELGIEPVTLS